jgi:hypothetical protein
LEDNGEILRHVSKTVAARRLDSSGYAQGQVSGSFEKKMVVNLGSQKCRLFLECDYLAKLHLLMKGFAYGFNAINLEEFTEITVACLM